MYKFDKYARPYCENCKLVWGKQNIGLVMSCTKCGRKLILKSFNPLPLYVRGLGIISLGGVDNSVWFSNYLDWWFSVGWTTNL